MPVAQLNRSGCIKSWRWLCSVKDMPDDDDEDDDDDDYDDDDITISNTCFSL